MQGGEVEHENPSAAKRRELYPTSSLASANSLNVIPLKMFLQFSIIQYVILHQTNNTTSAEGASVEDDRHCLVVYRCLC